MTTDNSKVLSIKFSDKSTLYAAYMPFIKDGALFISTPQEYDLGDDIILLVELLDETEQHSVSGKVVWITPKCAQGGRPAGVGIRLSEESQAFRNKVETYLAGSLQSDRRSDTL